MEFRGKSGSFDEQVVIFAVCRKVPRITGLSLMLLSLFELPCAAFGLERINGKFRSFCLIVRFILVDIAHFKYQIVFVIWSAG